MQLGPLYTQTRFKDIINVAKMGVSPRQCVSVMEWQLGQPRPKTKIEQVG